MSGPARRPLEEIAAELRRVEAELARLRREVAEALTAERRPAERGAEVTAADRAIVRARARRLGLVVREGSA